MKSVVFTTCIAALMLAWVCPCGFADQTLTLALDPPDVGNSGTVAKPKAAAKESATAASAARSQTTTIGRVGTVQAGGASIYRSKSTTSKKYATVKTDTPLAVIKEEGAWYGVLMVNGATGWVPRSAVKMTGYELVAAKPALSRSSAVTRGGPVDRPSTLGEALVQTAVQYEGVRYHFGGVNPSKGMDCSAFVRLVFSHHDVNLPRTAREQAQVGTTVPVDQLQPGDRLYFSCNNPYVDHCGIYAGGGYFVHCSSSQGGVAVGTLSSDFYWRSLVVAKRS